MTSSPVSLGTLIDQVSSSSDDPIERLASAATAADHLSTLGDQLIGHFVDTARGAGVSWALIGQALGGVSKQAAQKRFSPDFSRFTLRAKEVLTVAQRVAVEHQHHYIGTEHLVVGLAADPDGLSAKAFAELAGSSGQVRDAAIAAFAGPGEEVAKPLYTPRAKAALTRALSEALNLGHNYIGTEHLLLGVLVGGAVGEGPSLGARVLAEQSITYDAVQAIIARYLDEIQRSRK